MSTKHTPGPWRWQGEDYRAGWGWQMLVGPSGEGLIVGDENGEPSSLIKGFVPLDPEYCITGMAADGKTRANCVHVFGEANARLIAAAPELLEACHVIKAFLVNLENGTSEDDPLRAIRVRVHWRLHEALDAALLKAEGVHA